jgi:hypothetical protein
MDRRHFISQSAAALGLLAGFSSPARANLQKAEILVIGGGYILTPIFEQHSQSDTH